MLLLILIWQASDTIENLVYVIGERAWHSHMNLIMIFISMVRRMRKNKFLIISIGKAFEK